MINWLQALHFGAYFLYGCFRGEKTHVRSLVIIYISHSKLSNLPVVILKAIHLSNLSLSKCLLSNLLFARCTGKTRNVVCSLQCTDHMICNGLTTSPTKFQAGLRETEMHEVKKCRLLVSFLFYYSKLNESPAGCFETLILEVQFN